MGYILEEERVRNVTFVIIQDQDQEPGSFSKTRTYWPRESKRKAGEPGLSAKRKQRKVFPVFHVGILRELQNKKQEVKQRWVQCVGVFKELEKAREIVQQFAGNTLKRFEAQEKLEAEKKAKEAEETCQTKE